MSKRTIVAAWLAGAIAFAALTISLPVSDQIGRGGGYGLGILDGQG